MLKRVYLDNSATTPVDPQVVAAMLPFLTERYGNASSIHHFGQETRSAVDKARHQVSALLNCRPNEIIFTSGGTESNNLAIRGRVQSAGFSPSERDKSRTQNFHIITSSIEHPAVKEVCIDLETRGCDVTFLPCYENGIVRMDDVRDALRENTMLISVMAANNEIGTLQPIAEIGSLARELRKDGRKIWFHTDAVQAVGKMAIDVEEIGCDLLSISGHKIYAPKGIGALYVRRGTRLQTQNVGGRQERNLRGGTEPVHQIVALGEAADLAAEGLDESPIWMKELRDALEDKVFEAFPDATLNGDKVQRLPNISNISFPGVEGEGLLINLDMQGIAVSTGSACSSGSLEPSPVIRALGRDDSQARSAIRFSFGKYNTMADVDQLASLLPKAVETLRRLNRRP